MNYIMTHKLIGNLKFYLHVLLSLF